MRFWLCLLGLAMLISGCVISSSLIFTDADIKDSINLLYNPGFASSPNVGGEVLPGWDLHITPPDQEFDKISLDPAVAMTGNNSLKISASDKDIMLFSKPFKVRRYGGYFGKIYVKSDNPARPKVNLRMITFKENGKITNRFQKKGLAGTDWDKISLSAGFLRPGVSFGRLVIHIPPFSEGNIWIDDAGCWEVHGFKID